MATRGTKIVFILYTPTNFYMLTPLCIVLFVQNALKKFIYIYDRVFRDKQTNKHYHFDCFEDKTFKNEVLKIKFMLLLEK